MRSVVLRC